METLAKGIVSASHLSNIESGKYQPHADILRLLAEKLDVPQFYFLNYEIVESRLKELICLYEEQLIGSGKEFDSIDCEISRKYPYISSIFYETKYFILRACHLLKRGKLEEAESVYKNEYLPLVKNCLIPEEIVTYEYYYLGGLCLIEERNLESLRYYRLVLESTKNTSFQARIYYNIGLSYFKLNNFDQALKYVKKASEMYLLENKLEELADSYNLIGSIYIKLEELTLAIKYLDFGAKIAQEHNYTKIESRILHNLAILNKRKRQLKRATMLLDQSLSLKADNNDKIITTIELIEILLNNDREQEAIYHLGIIEKNSNKLSPINYHKFLLVRGRVNLRLGNVKEYIKDYDSALKFFFEQKLWKYINMYYEDYADNLFKNKRYKKAGEVYKLTLLSRKKEENNTCE